MSNYWRFETSAVHAGYSPDPTTRAVATPIYQTASFAFDDTQHSADLFDHKTDGFIYTRLANPTLEMLSQRIATLEQGAGALAVASGQAAVACAIQTIAGVGDNIVSASSLYGTTYNLFAHTFPQYGIEVRFAGYKEPNAFEKLIDANTKAIFCESIANPSGHVPDLAALAAIAHRRGIPLIVDNTVATPYLCRPFEHGADIVVHSLTKFLGGHGVALGGAIVDSGRFPWVAHREKFKRLTESDPCHHGIVFTDLYKERAYIARAGSVPVRNLGAVLSPMNAFLIMQGIETLALRMDRICFNTELIARFLKDHPTVSWVSYAGLQDHPDYAMTQKYMGGKASGVLSFGVKGELSAGIRLQDSLSLIRRSVNIGDCKSLACHPASTTHRQLSRENLEKSGVTEDMIRLSIGIEHIEDLLTDLDQALAAAQSS
jgi:O-acetylhomoserine (thiol)-lyase